MPRQSSGLFVTSQVVDRLCLYIRALQCARFAPVEQVIVFELFTRGWIRPRLVYGRIKPQPIELSPTELGRAYGFDRSRVSEGIRHLKAGNVILENDRGEWTLSSRWQAWLTAIGLPRVKPTCYERVETGHPADHVCAPDPDAAPEDGPQHSPQDEQSHEVADAVAQMQRTIAELTATVADLQRRLTEAGQPQVVPSTVADPQRAEADAQRSAGAQPDLPAQVLELQAVYCTVAEAQRALPNGNTSVSADESPAYREPASVPAPAMSGSQSSEFFLPAEDTIPGIPYIDKNKPMETPRADAELDVYRYIDGTNFGTSFEGPETPDDAIIQQAMRLAEQKLPLDAIMQGITDYKYMYPSDWILKALKRTIVKKVNIRTFGYIRSILCSWRQVGRPDAGPEDQFDHTMRGLPRPEPSLAAAQAGTIASSLSILETETIEERDARRKRVAELTRARMAKTQPEYLAYLDALEAKMDAMPKEEYVFANYGPR